MEEGQIEIPSSNTSEASRAGVGWGLEGIWGSWGVGVAEVGGGSEGSMFIDGGRRSIHEDRVWVA